jgi:HlyD family secretion protein
MKKIVIIAVILVVVAGLIWFSVSSGSRNAVVVQTGKVATVDSLASVVSASGEIKPKTYVNIGANAFGKIVKLYVKEGDQVKRGQLLAQIESAQPAADVEANRAALEVSSTDSVAATAALKRAQADLERTKLDYERASGLLEAGLIPKSDYDTKKTAYDAAVAALAQAQAQDKSARQRIGQQRATLARVSDMLSKTTYAAPFDGVITNLPVREGETVVVGIQNSPGSTLMTLADTSVITAEVKVDETDIVNIKNGQVAEVTIDAIPGKTFKGYVSEIGNNALLRSTGVSTAQATTGATEAKDFKVVVTLQDPPENLRPGLSTTAKITTAKKDNVLAVPIQALTIRTPKDLEEKKSGSSGSVKAAAPEVKSAEASKEIQGVFVVEAAGRNSKVRFVPVKTGITGSTDIEVTEGLKPNEQIVTGSYKVLRTLKNGATVKIDNSAAKAPEEKS